MELAELGEIAKSNEDKRNNRRLAGASASALGLGTLASGVPGYNPDPMSALGEKKTHAAGILGRRDALHRGAENHFDYMADKTKGPSKTAQFKSEFWRGKIAPEKKVLNNLRTGRKIGHAAQAAGAAGLGLSAINGIRRKRAENVEASKAAEGEKVGGAAQGFGAATAVGGAGLAAALGSQEKRWGRAEKKSQAEARKLMSSLPKKPLSRHTLDDVNGQTVRGVSPENLKAAARHSAAARQGRHFKDIYRLNKLAMAGGAGAGGLVALAGRRKSDPQ